MDRFLLILLFTLVTFNLILGFRRRQLYHILPSLSWISLSVIPFMYSQRFFPETTIMSQGIGVALVGIALCFGDLYSIFFIKTLQKPRNIKIEIHKNKLFFYMLTGLLLLIPVIHFYLTGSIPLLNKIFGNFSSLETSINREIYMKISIPYWFKIISNWCVTLIGPTLLAFLFYKRKFWQAIILFLWILFYAYSSTEQAPSVFLIISTIMMSIQFWRNNLRNFVAAVFIIIFGTTVIIGTYYGNTVIKRSQECPIAAGTEFTPANVSRSCTNDNLITINPVIDRIGYRIFLTPIEVSNYWYQYFDHQHNNKRSVKELANRDLKSQASNEVGIWAFQSNFPEKYLSTVSAYSSIDADAYSFGGILGIFFVSLILLFIRIYIARSKDTDNLYEKILNGLGMTFLMLFPFQASLQAILIPQGLIVLILAIFWLRNRDFLTKKLSK